MFSKIPSVEQVLAMPKELLPKILCPDGECGFHNVAHMTAVASNALNLSRYYGLPTRNTYLAFLAGLFHDAGRKDILDKLNIETALTIASKYAPISPVDWPIFSKYLSATEFSEEKTQELASSGTLGELIVRDSDFLVWANKTKQEGMFRGLSEETGTKVDLQSTTQFLQDHGVFLPRSQRLLRKAGIPGVPQIASALLAPV